MLGNFTKGLMEMMVNAAPEVQVPFYGYGRAPRKIVAAGPPAQYQDGPNGDIHRARAIKRAERWRAANPSKGDAGMPRHIWNNFSDATNYATAT